jgi:excisionase family DNA binding protein
MANAGPALYTVEEAAKLLRIGRTKAYALTQEWRATGGESGLPVVVFGHVLRVPRAALEKLLGVDLDGSSRAASEPPAGIAVAREAEPVAEAVTATASAPAPKRRHRSPHTRSTDQLDLFNVVS